METALGAPDVSQRHVNAPATRPTRHLQCTPRVTTHEAFQSPIPFQRHRVCKIVGRREHSTSDTG
jgi:hypothetical protein